jgi:WD40 repeat protein
MDRDILATRGSYSGGTVVLAPDGKMFARAYGGVQIWDVKGEKATLRKTLKDAREGAVALAFSPDGKLLAAGQVSKNVVWWAMPEGRLLTAVEADKGPPGPAVWTVAFSPDGKTLASGGNDGTVRLWDLTTRQIRAQLPHARPITSLAFSPDAHYIASGTDAGEVRVWDATTGKRLLLHEGVKATLGGRVLVAFTPDSKRLAVARGARLEIWEVAQVIQQ